MNRHFGTSLAYQRTEIWLPAGEFAIDEVEHSFDTSPIKTDPWISARNHNITPKFIFWDD